jgi:cAMP phosphodiesterase
LNLDTFAELLLEKDLKVDSRQQKSLQKATYVENSAKELKGKLNHGYIVRQSW